MPQTELRGQGEPVASREHVEGMGPIILETGVAFRVWAPHADRVCVVGDFNQWNADANPMDREEGGNWFTNIENAKPGDEYKRRHGWQGWQSD